MSIGKYLTNIGVLGALLGALSTRRQTRSMPNDWRRLVVWGVWAAGLLLSLAGVAKQEQDERFAAARKQESRGQESRGQKSRGQESRSQRRSASRTR